jgi:hypothetical protein
MADLIRDKVVDESSKAASLANGAVSPDKGEARKSGRDRTGRRFRFL